MLILIIRTTNDGRRTAIMHSRRGLSHSYLPITPIHFFGVVPRQWWHP
jgi:hypothetical protein